MKKLFTFIAMGLMGAAGAGLATGCGEKTETAGPLEIANALTPEEIAAGVLTPEIMWKMGRIGEFALSPDGTRVVYGRTDYNVGENRGVTTLWVQELDSTEAVRLTDYEASAGNVVWSADGSKVYFLSGRGGSSQVWSVAADGTALKQVSDIAGDVEYFGISEAGGKMWYVQRVKVENRTGSEVYPDLDKSGVKIYDDLMVRHWDRWTDGSHLHIFVTDFDSAASGATVAAGVDIMAGEPFDSPGEPYFDAAEIAWNNAGTQIAYTCKKLAGVDYALSTDTDIYVYDLAAGTTVNICKEYGGLDAEPRTDGIMVNRVVMPGYDRYPVWSPDDSRIAFRSMRRAGNEADKERLFVFDTAAKSFVDLTADFDHSATNVLWKDNEEMFFIAPYFGTYQVCRVPAAGGDVTLVTEGDHDIVALSMAGSSAVVSLTKQDRATELYSLSTASARLFPLTNVNGDIFANIKTGKVEKRWIETTDGKQMLTWVVYPPDFDPTKKYPALLYCEGGPQSTISQMWSYRWNFQLMAARGYIVVAPNRRGTPSFGQEWTDQISGDYSGQNIRDLLSAIDEVAKEPFVDSERLGCVGASYGGYSAFYLAGVHENRFKAFIAHCGIFNFESMYGHTEELFFVTNDYGGPYWSENPTAVRSYAASPHKLVKNWNTPIMIITGLRDYRIPYTQSIEAHTAARVMGIPSRLVAFDDEAHQVFQPQNNLVWNREFFGWLDKYVAGDGSELSK
ncbi:MAG: S9 family peptidase [Alistipes sp.]|jgi:dipeptidyl aminopeptidase/acylaminoacyl peptidase|nr:S9 family peptidase [Alistipes sp.]